MSDSPQPPSDPRGPYPRLVPMLLGLTGLLGTGALFWALRGSDERDASMEFQRAVRGTIVKVSGDLNTCLDQVHSTVALFDSSERVDLDEFETFTQKSFDRCRALGALLWFEADQASGALVHTVRYAEGPEASAVAVGTSLEAELGVRQDLASAGQEPVVTPPLEDVVPGGIRVLALRPVFASDGTRVGVVAGLLAPERLLESVAAEESRVLLEDVTAHPTRTIGGQAIPEGLRVEDLLAPGPGRRWRMTLAPPEGWLAGYRSYRPWIVLLLGVCTTGLLVGLVTVEIGRKTARRLVERRTREIMETYDTLAYEAQERVTAEADLTRLERRMREIIDLVPDMIYVKDWHGRFLLANEAAAEAFGGTVTELSSPRELDLEDFLAEPGESTREERALMRSCERSVVPEMDFVDAGGRRRVLHMAKIPCDVVEGRARALLCVATDVTERHRAEKVLRIQNRILAHVARGAELGGVLDEIARAVSEVLPDARCHVLLVSEDGRHLVLGSAPETPSFLAEALDGVEIGPTSGCSGAAAHARERFVVEDVRVHDNCVPFRDVANRAGVRSCWSEPILSTSGDVLGTLSLHYGQPHVPDASEVHMGQAMARLASIAVERDGSLQAARLRPGT